MGAFMRIARVFVLLATSGGLIASGCSEVAVRSSRDMLTVNPMEKLAIIVESNIVYPQGKGKEPILDIATNKKALSRLIPMTKEIFEEKGYDVLYCEPAGIRYHKPDQKAYRITANYAVDGISKAWKKKDRQPVYEYPGIRENPALAKALHAIFEEINEASAQERIYSYIPSKEDFAVISAITGADTICINTIYGIKYLSADKRKAAGLAVLGVILGSSKKMTLTDKFESFFICVNAKTGDVLWEHGLYKPGNPDNPKRELLEEVLEPFPRKGQPLESKYRK